MKNQWSRKIFLKTKKKMLWARVKRLGTLLSLPLLRRLVFLRRRERETRVTREWLVTTRKGAEERRQAKSRPFSPSRPTSFPGFRPTRIYGARGGQVRENPGNEVASHFLSSFFVPRTSCSLSRRGLRIPEHEGLKGLRISSSSCSDLAD